MTNYDLPYFGQIDLTALRDYYSTVGEFNESEVKLDINFANRTIESTNADKLKYFLEHIEKFDKKNKVFIKNDFESGEGETSDYVNFYLEECDEEELLNIIGDSKETSKDLQLLDKLKLIRVGLYPDDKYETGHFGIFDYSIDIDGKPCNQLLVILTNNKGDLYDITWES